MAIKKWIFVFFLLNIFSYMNLNASGLDKLLPNSIEGWKPSDKDRYYNPETLYNYINGGAELYISYGFREVISRTYSKTGQSNLTVEIFDMVEAKNAFGVFCHVREDVDYSYGQGCQVYEGVIIFWKNKYFISVVSEDEAESSMSAIRKLAENIDNLIKGEGELPGIIKMAPRKGLIEESILYFFHSAWLNSFYYISDENILNINEKTHCILAKYGDTENRYYLLIIEYPEVKDARGAFESFNENYSKEIQTSATVEIEEGSWMACKTMNKILVGVFNAGSKTQALELMNQVPEK